MSKILGVLPPWVVLDEVLRGWLIEDVGRGDRTTQAILSLTATKGTAEWIAKEAGRIAGLPLAARIFYLLDRDSQFLPQVAEGEFCSVGTVVARMEGVTSALLTGERVALNLAMHLSGIATMTQQYVEAIADFPTQFVDTRKTTPGLRILEKYATQIGGAKNHRMGLDDAVMIKDNHIQAAGGIVEAIARVRAVVPYPLSIEVETTHIEEVKTALAQKADIIMLDNMSLLEMKEAVTYIRQQSDRVKIEASGNITLKTIREVAATGVDYISSSAPIARSTWLDLSMNLQ
ncbi:MAG: carboxylating nicotinate-nucleotide diphosphorylase [Jaaginema sp. PMC 1079.18]|nr:carboxylating nicotinate-nucleotide diphosphorylase [Jaaginema sp. PMC 1080.18]MEC4850856.1 carboxylating nicotinate-nucleotide diphosphorylase [Jaaginema sp. PMC 1079.18]MEC4866271.1 carboxylating nicotinate-nucleotide diphosphorylase [Jaaginema sp. PMC 1078.18]